MEIFDTNTDTKSHSLLKLVLKLQVLYYTSLQIANVKQIAPGAWSWPYKFVPGGLFSLVIQTYNPMSNSQAQNSLVLSLKTTHQMDDSAIKNLSEYDIVIPKTQE